MWFTEASVVEGQLGDSILQMLTSASLRVMKREMTDSTQLIGQLGHCSNHAIPILTPEATGGVIVPAHQVKRDFLLLVLYLGCKTKIEGDRYFRGSNIVNLMSIWTMGVTIPSFKLILSANFWTRWDPALASICLLPQYQNLFLGFFLKRL